MRGGPRDSTLAKTDALISGRIGITASGSMIRKLTKLGCVGATQPGIDRTAMTAVSWSSSSQNPAIHVGSGGSALAATTSPNETIAATRRTSARAISEDSNMF